VCCELIEVPENWIVTIVSQVFIGTQVLGEDNKVTIDMMIHPPSDFEGSEELTIHFVSMAAGHPEAGVFETNRTITVFSS
jgi:hypothetical protein